ncbi:ABC transporter permease [Halostella litorea]|uniref:ABC transporter permease n=1 Tax=Halostella litorea TaxID=2528831 RepID=UPI0013873C54|nr:ABC transporter permease subunit [Halostella litorea]
MTWVPLARREAYVRVRTLGVWGIAVLLFFWASSGFRGIREPIPAVVGPDAAVLALQGAIGNSVLIGGLILGHRAVIDERTTGAIRLTAAMPHTRRDILLGKVAGLTVPFLAVVGVCIGVVTVAGSVTYGLPSPLRLVGFALVSWLYVCLCVGIGVAISAVVSSSLRATLAMLLVLVVTLFWRPLVSRVYTLLTGIAASPLDPPANGLLFLFRRLDPRSAYYLVTNWIYDIGNAPGQYDIVVRKLHPSIDAVYADVYVAGPTFDSVPLYLSQAVGIVVLVGGLLVSLGIATRRFQQVDL